jgi:hypothetical protein
LQQQNRNIFLFFCHNSWKGVPESYEGTLLPEQKLNQSKRGEEYCGEKNFIPQFEESVHLLRQGPGKSFKSSCAQMCIPKA